MNKKEMMFDIETLSVEDDAVVLSYGAVVFETFVNDKGVLDWTIIETASRTIKLDPQFEAGRRVEESTLMWWMDQSEEARAAAFSPKGRSPISIAAGRLFNLARCHEVTRFWAAPDSFDFPIWQSLCRGANVQFPWKYNQKRDGKTVIDEAGYHVDSHTYSKITELIPHDPIHDCYWQIDVLTAARHKLGRRIGEESS